MGQGVIIVALSSRPRRPRVSAIDILLQESTSHAACGRQGRQSIVGDVTWRSKRMSLYIILQNCDVLATLLGARPVRRLPNAAARVSTKTPPGKRNARQGIRATGSIRKHFFDAGARGVRTDGFRDTN